MDRARIVLAFVAAYATACSLALRTDEFTGGSDLEAVRDGAADAVARDGAREGSAREDGGVVIEDGLVGRWAFDEASGTIARDSSPFGNHGDVVNGTWTFGHSGGAIALSGTDSHVEVAHHPSLAVTSTFTVALWATAVVVGYDAHLLARGTGLTVLLEKRSPRLEIDGKFAEANYSLPAEEWHHIAVAFERGTVAWYIDGNAVANRAGATFTGGEAAPESTAKTMIGTSALGEASYDGSLDDVRLYDRALSKDEIAALARE